MTAKPRPIRKPTDGEKPVPNRLAELEAKWGQRKANYPPPSRDTIPTKQEAIAKEAAEKLGVTWADARHYAKALVHWGKAGFPVREQSEVERIEREICRPCSDYVKGRCRLCGCRVTASSLPIINKIKMATEHCRRGKWPGETSSETLMEAERNETMPENAPTEPGLYWAVVVVPKNAVPPRPGSRVQDGVVVQTTEEEIAAAQAEQPEGYNAIVDVDGEIPFLSLRQAMLVGQPGIIRLPRAWRLTDIIAFGSKIERPTT